MPKVKMLVFSWLPPLLWMVLIFFLSSFNKLQASPIGWQDFIVRKSAHFLEYAVLFFLYHRALKNTINVPVKRRLLLALFLTIFYALSDEFHQTFVAGRTGKTFDVGVDSLGAFFGLLFSWKVKQ